MSTKLQQGQVWKDEAGEYLRIVHLERLIVGYKLVRGPNPNTRDGTHHQVSKKAFCRLIKKATLLPPSKTD